MPEFSHRATKADGKCCLQMCWGRGIGFSKCILLRNAYGEIEIKRRKEGDGRREERKGSGRKEGEDKIEESKGIKGRKGLRTEGESWGEEGKEGDEARGGRGRERGRGGGRGGKLLLPGHRDLRVLRHRPCWAIEAQK